MDERQIALIFRGKGFKYAVQFNKLNEEPYGDPVYFKEADEVGTFMRAHNLIMVWTKTVEEIIQG
jgi:hypothetical protein